MVLLHITEGYNRVPVIPVPTTTKRCRQGFVALDLWSLCSGKMWSVEGGVRIVLPVR